MQRQEYQRFLDHRLRVALSESPVVLLTGPRQCGKTTLARSVAADLGHQYLSFDDANLLQAARLDPVGFLDPFDGPLILDEIQKAPELFPAIKLRVDQKRRPGEFLLTGSANVLLAPRLADSLAGRIEMLRLHPLALCELARGQGRLLNRLFSGELPVLSGLRNEAELADRVLTGGFPEPVHRASWQAKRRWHRNYAQSLLQKDVQDLARVHKLDLLPALLELLASQTGCLLNQARLASLLQLSRQTAKDYFSLLEKLYLLEQLPAWHKSQSRRLVKTPKVHLSDSGLAAALTGFSPDGTRHRRELFGRLLESHVYNELRRQASWAEEEFRFYYYRDKDQVEVDLLIEREDGRLIAIEVKASATARLKDFAGMQKLRAQLGESLVGRYLLYGGDHSLSFGEAGSAIPVRVLAD